MSRVLSRVSEIYTPTSIVNCMRMPAIGPVYQPTTYNVGYETQSEWQPPSSGNRIASFLDWIQSEECCRKLFVSSVVIVLLFVFYVLLEWIATVFFDYRIFSDSNTFVNSIVFYSLFIIFVLACFVLLLLFYLRFMKNKRFYFWPFVRKEGLSRQLNSQARNGQVSYCVVLAHAYMLTLFQVYELRWIYWYLVVDFGFKSINWLVGNTCPVWSCNRATTDNAGRRWNQKFNGKWEQRNVRLRDFSNIVFWFAILAVF